jgi:hypothetical protein
LRRTPMLPGIVPASRHLQHSGTTDAADSGHAASS